MAKFERLSHREIRQVMKRDELKDFVETGVSWLKGHLEAAVIAGVSVVVLAFLVPFYLSSRADREAKAAELLSQATLLFRQSGSSLGGDGNYGQARSQYQEIITLYGGSAAGRQAELGLANCDLEAGKLDLASQEFDTFLARHAKDSLAPLALAGTGYCLEASGKHVSAADAFASVQQRYPSAPNLQTSLLDSARNYDAGGDPASGKKMRDLAAKMGLSSGK
jgi:outer membrane protein assembly factor BamD (BamD/ComL family)